MSELPPFDPSVQAGAVDPTLQGGNTQFTLAECPPDALTRLEAYMSSAHDGHVDMRLEAGTSLAEQCNANYGSLNERGISMPQYVGVLEAAATTAKEIGHTKDIFWGDNPRISHEVIGHREGLSGERHPPTGDLIPSTINTFAVVPRDGVETTDREDEMSLYEGFSDLEIEMARLGVFSARHGDEEGAACRADEILDRLAATQTGLRILEENGIVVNERGVVGRKRPERPIELLTEQSTSGQVVKAATEAHRQTEGQEQERVLREIEELFALNPDAWTTSKLIPAADRGKSGKAYQRALERSPDTESVLRLVHDYNSPERIGYITPTKADWIRRRTVNGRVTYTFFHDDASRRYPAGLKGRIDSSEGWSGATPSGLQPFLEQRLAEARAVAARREALTPQGERRQRDAKGIGRRVLRLFGR